MDWYNNLNKPFLNPPSSVFMPVWIILYIMIFISILLFLRKGMNKSKIVPLVFFIIQMGLNISWQGIFFGMQEMIWGLIVILLMWFFILLTIIGFYRHSKAASLMLVPYFLWVTFACWLNFEYVRLN